MIVSILQQKGGAGKTTISINLARAMALAGEKVLLVDSDSQGSARDWSNGDLLNVIGLDRPTIDKDIKSISYDYKWIFVDGSPGFLNQGPNPMIIPSIKCADIVLIPVQPSPLDLWATETLVKLVHDRIEMTDGKLKAAFVVSRQIPQTLIGKEIRGILEGFKLPVFETGTYQRVMYATSFASGSTVIDQPDSDAKTEILKMAQELRNFV